jgi:hypothetical protein
VAGIWKTAVRSACAAWHFAALLRMKPIVTAVAEAGKGWLRVVGYKKRTARPSGHYG